MHKFHLKKEFWIIVIAVLVLSAGLAGVDGRGHWLQGWMAYLVLFAFAALSIFGFWSAVKPGSQVTRIALISFFLRLAVGTALALLLPIIGYQDNPEHLAGYVYTDAYIRDGQAWSLASSGAPLTQAFSGQYSGDQYGGMLAISAFIYRTISPDVQRPLLIIILGAAASAWGILCLGSATRSWFDDKTALLASWFFALYPESVLLGSSQMREAILLPLTAVAYYGLSEIMLKKRTGWLWLALSALLIFPIQPLAGFISFAVLAGVWLLDPSTTKNIKRGHTILLGFLVVGILLATFLVVSSILASLPSLKGSGPFNVFLTWFQNNFNFQSYITARGSGMLQSLLASAGDQWRWLVLSVYGIAQPVLPAIVGDPTAAPVMRLIGFLRAAGWYLLALLLVYGSLAALRSRMEARRVQLIWISLVSWAWILVSALNAGADQWDNPRYRAILLLWQVILAAWAWQWARSHRDAWLWRWLAVEVVFVGLFTEWYLGRYYPGFFHLDIKIMIALTLVLCGLILVGGLAWDKIHKNKISSPNNRL